MLTKNDRQQLIQDFKQVFATKIDLNSLASKKDLVGLARGSEVDTLKLTFIDKLAGWKSELFTKIDSVLGRLIDSEQDNTILKSRFPRKSKLLERVKKIEQHLDLPTSSVT